ncbi:MAG: VWA domain-containing protein, partial [Aureliella sp.]
YPGGSVRDGYDMEAMSVRGRRVELEHGGSPSVGGDQYAAIVENNFERVQDAPLSTFSIDVDTASYAKCRQLLMEANQLPPAAAVRLEEFINYFDYQYTGPTDDSPLAAHLAVASCPWQPEHQLVRIALQAPKLELAQRPAANIVFLLDVSGSMNEPNKLPLVKEAMRMLIEQLGENDRLAMVVYAGAAGCVLESTRGDQQQEILAALDRLSAGGSTNGGDGIQLAYNLARDHYIPGGINRVILCTDGDFNVGVTNTQALVDLVVEQARSKTFLTVLGFGMGNTNDAMMEQISNRGNGVYGFVDSWREAKRQMVQQLVGNLMTVAKDVKLQVEFNPQKIKAYRLLGYENRVMAAQDFNDDKKDAGEIGAGHRVTALYEVVSVDSESSDGRDAVDELRYQPRKTVAITTSSDEPSVSPMESGDHATKFEQELLAVKLRYKQPEGETSQLRVFPLVDEFTKFAQADADLRWAASMVEFGMLLRGSRYSGSANWSGLVEQATAAAGNNPDPQREECLQMIRHAAQLSGQ